MHCTVVVDSLGGAATHSASISCVESLLSARLYGPSELAERVGGITLVAVSSPGGAAAVAPAWFAARQLQQQCCNGDANNNINNNAATGASPTSFLSVVEPAPTTHGQTDDADSGYPAASTGGAFFFCFAGTVAPSKEALAQLRRTIVARRGHVVVISAFTAPALEIEVRAVLETASGANSSNNTKVNNTKDGTTPPQQQHRHVVWLRAAHLGPATRRPAGTPVSMWCATPLELFCAGVALGVVRAFPVPGAQNADVVPVDVAVSVALLSFQMPQKVAGSRSATSNSRVRELRVISLVAPPTEGLVWAMVGEYVQDYYGRHQAAIAAAMPPGSFVSDPTVAFRGVGGLLGGGPLDSYRYVRSNQQKGLLMRSPHSATAEKIRVVLGDLDLATSYERNLAPQFRGAADEDEEDTYGMLLRYLSQRRETGHLVLACSLTAVQWEMYVKRVAVDVLRFISVRLMQMPAPPRLPQPTPLWVNDVFFASDLRAPPPNSALRRLFEATTFALRSGVQPNGEYVPASPGGTQRRFHDILAQPHVQMILSQISKNDTIDRSTVERRAMLILASIGDQSNHRDARSLVLIVRSLFRMLYTHINVLPTGTMSYSRMWSAVKMPRTSVILVPSHRSYIDNIITPYLVVMMGLPMPHICAGEDFLRLGAPLANALRGSGCFFMRRTFRTDKLYAALFREYVKGLVLGFQSIAFFPEGMRSRSGRSLPPKMGVLKMITDAFFEGGDQQINDVLFVPVSLSYERLVESSLYARELLGIPKPPENLANLARGSVAVVQEKYGSLNVNFGEPISVAALASRLQVPKNGEPDEVKRAARQFTPARLLTSLAGSIVQALDDNMVVTPTAVVASVLLCMTDTRNLRQPGVALDRFAASTEWLRGVVLRFGGKMSPEFAALDGARLVSYVVPMLRPHVNVSSLSHLYVEGDDQVTSLMALSIYHNQLVHLFLVPGAVAVVLASGGAAAGSASPSMANTIDNNNKAGSPTTDAGTAAAAATASSWHASRPIGAVAEDVRWLHGLLRHELPAYSGLAPDRSDAFAVGVAQLESLGVLRRSGLGGGSTNPTTTTTTATPSLGSRATPAATAVELASDALTQFCAMAVYPFVECFFVSALSLFALTVADRRFDEIRLLSLCHRVAIELRKAHLLAFAQACNKEMMRSALASFRGRGILRSETDAPEGLRVAAQLLLVPSYEEAATAELRAFVLRINRYRWHPATSSDITACIQRVTSAALSSTELLTSKM